MKHVEERAGDEHGIAMIITQEPGIVDVPIPTDVEDEDLDLALRKLPPLANQIVDAAIDNMSRKLIAGYRNKKTAVPNSKKVDFSAETKEALRAASAGSVMDVANRGQAWKEMVQKTMTRGIGSLSTLQFDGEFKVVGGKAEEGFKSKMPNTPGVYVVYDDATGRPVYVGDSDKMSTRWDNHLGEHKRGQKPENSAYKLSGEFENGCTVKFIKMDSRETAAALEAHLIRENFDNFKHVPTSPPGEFASRAERDRAVEDGMFKNKRNELENEQGTRSNQEAKKIKDASGSVGHLALGAGKEAAINIGADQFHMFSTEIVKAVKDELVDVVRGGRASIAVRVERVLRRLAKAVTSIDLWGILRGMFEFIVNALSKAIGQVMNLAKNLWDLGNGAWQLYKGAETMSREELVRKVSATIITTGSLVVWDALDPLIEGKLAGVMGPFAPYVSATLVAVGFGLSSYLLNEAVTAVIDAVIRVKQGYTDALIASRDACDRIFANAEMELKLLTSLAEYTETALDLHQTLEDGTAALREHTAMQPIEFEAMFQELA